LKVLELDFLKRRDRTSDCYHQVRFLGFHRNALAAGAYSAPPDFLAGFEGAASPAYAYKSAGLL